MATPIQDPTLDYFDSSAARYQQRSGGGLWARLRAAESEAVRSALGSVKGKVVLEVGCGAGYYSRLLLEWGARCVWAVDASARMLERLPKGRIEPVLGDAQSVAIGRHFDYLLAAGLFEFLSDPRAVLQNLAGHANDDALLVLLLPRQCPAGQLYRWWHRSHGVRVHLFDWTTMSRMARTAGWTAEPWRRVGLFSAVLRLRRKT